MGHVEDEVTPRASCKLFYWLPSVADISANVKEEQECPRPQQRLQEKESGLRFSRERCVGNSIHSLMSSLMFHVLDFTTQVYKQPSDNRIVRRSILTDLRTSAIWAYCTRTHCTFFFFSVRDNKSSTELHKFRQTVAKIPLTLNQNLHANAQIYIFVTKTKQANTQTNKQRRRGEFQ